MSSFPGISLLAAAAAHLDPLDVSSASSPSKGQVPKQDEREIPLNVRVAKASQKGLSRKVAAPPSKPKVSDPQPVPMDPATALLNETNRWLRANAKGKSGEGLMQVLVEAQTKYAAAKIDYPLQGLISLLNRQRDAGEPEFFLPEMSVSALSSSRCLNSKKTEPPAAPKSQKIQNQEQDRSVALEEINDWLAHAANGKTDREIDASLEEALKKFNDAGFEFAKSDVYRGLASRLKLKSWRHYSESLNRSKKTEPPAASKSQKIQNQGREKSVVLGEINAWLACAAIGKTDREIDALLEEALKKFNDAGFKFSKKEVYLGLSTRLELKPWIHFSSWLSDSKKPAGSAKPKKPAPHSQEDSLNRKNEIDRWVRTNAKGKSGQKYDSIGIRNPMMGTITQLNNLKGRDEDVASSIKPSSRKRKEPAPHSHSQEVLNAEKERIHLKLLTTSDGKSGEELSQLIENARDEYALLGIQITFDEVTALLDDLRSE